MSERKVRALVLGSYLAHCVCPLWPGILASDPASAVAAETLQWSSRANWRFPRAHAAGRGRVSVGGIYPGCLLGCRCICQFLKRLLTQQNCILQINCGFWLSCTNLFDCVGQRRWVTYSFVELIQSFLNVAKLPKDGNFLFLKAKCCRKILVDWFEVISPEQVAAEWRTHKIFPFPPSEQLWQICLHTLQAAGFQTEAVFAASREDPLLLWFLEPEKRTRKYSSSPCEPSSASSRCLSSAFSTQTWLFWYLKIFK